MSDETNNMNGYPEEWEFTGPPTLAPAEFVDAYNKAHADDPLLKAMQNKVKEKVDEKQKKKKPKKKTSPETGDEKSDKFETEELWPDPVNGSELAKEIRTILEKYLALPDHTPTTIALWTMFSYVYDEFDCCPILAVVSPEKRCGKTSLLSLLTSICRKPLAGSNITPAATFRAIEKWHPTLIVDEADTFIKQNEELRGILNSGHTRATAYVTRAVQKGKKFDVEQFSTWTPKVIALIGKLPDTLADRSITVKMRRKKSDELKAKIRYSKLHAEFKDLRRKLLRWGEDVTLNTEPNIPKGLDDRAGDNWIPLLSIAEKIGWSEQAERAATTLSGKTDTDTIRTELLSDIQEIFESKDYKDKSTIPSKELLGKLIEMDEKPWPTYHRGKELSGRGLASLLKPFGISSSLIRFSDGPARGYEKDSFIDPFNRYLSVTSVTTLNGNDLQDNLSVTGNEVVTDKKPRNSMVDSNVTDVTDRNGVPSKKAEYSEEMARMEGYPMNEEKAPF